MIRLNQPWEIDADAQRFVRDHPDSATFKEIAAELCVSEDKVTSIYQRAIRKLQRANGARPHASDEAPVESGGMRDAFIGARSEWDKKLREHRRGTIVDMMSDEPSEQTMMADCAISEMEYHSFALDAKLDFEWEEIFAVSRLRMLFELLSEGES